MTVPRRWFLDLLQSWICMCTSAIRHSILSLIYKDRDLQMYSLEPPICLCYRPFWGGGPRVVLVLCGLVVFTTGGFVLWIALLFVLVFFPSCSAFWSPRFGRGLVYVLLVRLFVCFARVDFCLFLPLGVRDWLRLLIVALHGSFY